jgi:hypothetical protein
VARKCEIGTVGLDRSIDNSMHAPVRGACGGCPCALAPLLGAGVAAGGMKAAAEIRARANTRRRRARRVLLLVLTDAIVSCRL